MVTFIHSLKFRMSLLTVSAVIIAAVIILALVIPEAKSAILDQTENYLQDVTVSNGATLEMMRKQIRVRYWLRSTRLHISVLVHPLL